MPGMGWVEPLAAAVRTPARWCVIVDKACGFQSGITILPRSGELWVETIALTRVGRSGVGGIWQEANGTGEGLYC